MYRKKPAGVAFREQSPQYTGHEKETALTRIALILLTLAFVLGLWSRDITWWPGRIAILWLAFSVALVGVAYLGLWPGMLLKSRRGTLYRGSWLLMGPFRLFNVATFTLYHRLSPEPAWAEIVPRLFLGRRLWDKEARALGPIHVLDLTCEMSETRFFREQEGYHCIPVLDNGCPSPDQLRAGVAWLKENHGPGPVYVHCAAGHGRSATVVIAYLLSIGAVYSVEEGIALLKSKRPGVYLNPDQCRGLAPFVACHLRGNAHNTDRRPGP